jgi:hypothetical protein
MTPPHPHCDHECVCPTYKLHCAYGYPCTHNGGFKGTVVTEECLHDTRLRPVSSAAGEAVLDELDQLNKKLKGIQFGLFHTCWDKRTIEVIKLWGDSLQKIEDKIFDLRQQGKGEP